MTVVEVSRHHYANAVAALLLAAFLGLVWYQGNLGLLLLRAKDDFVGVQGQGAFWKWALALVILYALASNKSTSGLFAPFLGIVIVAMLIEAGQSGRLSALNQALGAIFGSNKNTSPGLNIPTGVLSHG